MSEDELMARITTVQQRYADWLMKMPHVVGVGVGFASVQGEMSQEVSLVVMVDQKLPEDQLPPDQRIPRQLDGVRVDVQETGVFTAGV
ncbi:MAG: hypothetical protein U0694_28555 [Anaerolineae bacterium]